MLHNLGGLYFTQGKFSEAERILKQAFDLAENRLPPNVVAAFAEHLAQTLRKLHRGSEADIYENKARTLNKH